MNCEILVYQVSMRYDIDDERWFEYEVQLWDDSKIVDWWDSYYETYNGVRGQRLTATEAFEAAREIADDVDAGNASDWFDVE